MPELNQQRSAACPVCSSRDAVRVCRRPATVVHQNLLYPSAAAARAATRGDIDLRACGRCGFVFNSSFDPTLVDYGPNYENCQEHSSNFAAHIDSLIGHLGRDHGITTGRVVEIGCGSGSFLTRLLTAPGNRCTGTGFDPAYRGPSERLAGRLRFVPALYGADSATTADVVICRHVIEHIPDPVMLLRTVRTAVGPDSRAKVFFETPCADWILTNRVLWDVFYEHCSLFTKSSLELAMSRAGFEVQSIHHVFGGQYLWVEAVAGEASEDVKENAVPAQMARRFAIDEGGRVARWREMLEEFAAKGPIVSWGAAAKGVTFCNLADPEARRMIGVVDANPAKQGRFLAGTGHPILAPQDAARAATAVVLNPNYVAEISATLARLGAGTRVIDLMHLGHAPTTCSLS